MYFFFQNEATFPLVRKEYYKEPIHGGLYIKDQGSVLISIVCMCVCDKKK